MTEVCRLETNVGIEMQMANIELFYLCFHEHAHILHLFMCALISNVRLQFVATVHPNTREGVVHGYIIVHRINVTDIILQFLQDLSFHTTHKRKTVH